MCLLPQESIAKHKNWAHGGERSTSNEGSGHSSRAVSQNGCANGAANGHTPALPQGYTLAAAAVAGASH